MLKRVRIHPVQSTLLMYLLYDAKSSPEANQNQFMCRFCTVIANKCSNCDTSREAKLLLVIQNLVADTMYLSTSLRFKKGLGFLMEYNRSFDFSYRLNQMMKTILNVLNYIYDNENGRSGKD